MHDILIDTSLVFERAPPTSENFLTEGGYNLTLKLHDPHHDKYDWDDPEWVAQNKKRSSGFYAIYLTQGYFMLVSKRDYKRMTTYPDGRPKKWHVKVEYDEFGEMTKVYATRRGRGDEPKTVFAHREILNCLEASGDVDHVNGCGLDNRRQNLILGSRSLNAHNIGNHRRVNLDLLPGVEKRGFDRNGRQLFGGIRSRRLKRSGPGSVKTVRTKRHWLNQEKPHKWYLNQLKKLSGGRSAWVHAPKSLDIPVLPPHMDAEPTRRSSRLRGSLIEKTKSFADIPF